MSINSKFNCAFCLIFLLYPIHLCNQYKNEYFCSSIFNSMFAQYYSISIEVYLGGSIRMCSNITYILITVNHYMLIGREHSPVLERISKLELRNLILSTLTCSFLFNIGQLFQYQINYYDTMLHDNVYLYANFPVSYPILIRYGTSLATYSIICFILNYVAFLLINHGD
jgi:hypothetical protein